MYRNHFLNFYTLPLFCYNILKMAAIEVKLKTSSSQTRIHVVISVLIGQPISVCVNVCPAFLVCGSSLSGNRPCMRVCQTLRFSNNQLNKASGGPHSRGSPAGIGLRPGNISVSGSELRWCNCFRWSTLRGSTAGVCLWPGNILGPITCHRPLWEALRSQQENRFHSVSLRPGNKAGRSSPLGVRSSPPNQTYYLVYWQRSWNMYNLLGIYR